MVPVPVSNKLPFTSSFSLGAVVPRPSLPLAKSPNNNSGFNARSYVYAAKGDHQNAISDISKVISADQTNPELFFRRGDYYSKMSQYQNAINDYTKVTVLDVKNANAYYNRAVNYEQLLNYKAAASDYEKMIALSPDDYKAKDMMKRATEKLFELNKESFKPEIVLKNPKPNDRNIVKISSDKTDIIVKGDIIDASKIKSILINDMKAEYNKDSLNPSFSYKMFLVSEKEITVTATDLYDNTQKIIYTIERTEINKPTIELVSPFASSDNEIYLDKDMPELYVEGKIKDESLIESIMIEGVQASFQLDELNPGFSTKINIANKAKMNVKVKYIYCNKTNVN